MLGLVVPELVEAEERERGREDAVHMYSIDVSICFDHRVY